ncbi:MAG: prolipoprotein diacylglyceryl transferase [Alphaproteobacteria bacterium]|nr:prolipoprotein diacylglyceryl transferase [Alphaproteobacteria bacterium]
MIVIPQFSPIAFTIFGFGVHWYALAYIVSFIIGLFMFKWMARGWATKDTADDLLMYLVLGVILGGRLGYVIFYNLSYYLAHPLEILAIWQGGMAFHGGLIGVIIAVWLFCYNRRGVLHTPAGASIEPLQIFDTLSVIFPIGIFFGRIANFINMEVMGRPTDSTFGVVFYGAADQVARYPSPLFQAALEGALLFIIMFALWQFTRLRERTGALAGIFGMTYAVLRIIGEQFRAPDAHIGFIWGTSWLSMGMLLSAIMFIAGTAIFACAIKRN